MGYIGLKRNPSFKFVTRGNDKESPDSWTDSCHVCKLNLVRRKTEYGSLFEEVGMRIEQLDLFA